MTRKDLLPGVVTDDCPPRVVCDARAAIRRARRRAVLQDTLQLALVASLDWLFLRWPAARVPLLDRSASLAVLGWVNGAAVAWVWLARVLPRWRARMIAATWGSTERLRFLGRDRRQ